MTNTPSLYDRIGGAPTVRAAAEAIYVKMMGDPDLAGFFAGVTDVPGQIAHHGAYIALVLGGPNEYAGRDMRTAHAGLTGLAAAHFDKVLIHLREVLVDLKIPADTAGEIVAVAETGRHDVLGL